MLTLATDNAGIAPQCKFTVMRRATIGPGHALSRTDTHNTGLPEQLHQFVSFIFTTKQPSRLQEVFVWAQDGQ
jgi:hypothetical protein